MDERRGRRKKSIFLLAACALFSQCIMPRSCLVSSSAAGEQEHCTGGQCVGVDGALYGTEFLYDSHTVILAEGTEAEMRDPAWSTSFGMQYIAADDTCDAMGWRRRAVPRRVWDAFTFFNEVDVLRLRLHTLSSVVHRFVLAEATKTHSNLPKPLHFDAVKSDSRFSPFLPQIQHVVVDDLPDSEDSWKLEHFQRNALVRGLAEAADDDIVVVSDCDEIPSPHAVDLIRWCDGWDETGPVQFYTRFYNFKFAFVFEALWYHPQAATIGWLSGPKGQGSPERLRFARTRPKHLRLEDAGWHLSFFADTPGVVAKIKAYAHQEYNREDMLNETAIGEAITSGIDLFYEHGKGEQRFGKLHTTDSCHGLPKHVLDNAEVMRRCMLLAICYLCAGSLVSRGSRNHGIANASQLPLLGALLARSSSTLPYATIAPAHYREPLAGPRLCPPAGCGCLWAVSVDACQRQGLGFKACKGKAHKTGARGRCSCVT